MTFPGTWNATSTLVFAWTMPLAVVDHARVEGVTVSMTTGTAAVVSASFAALASARAQAMVAKASDDAATATATAVMRDLIQPPEK
jgi:hypothetical protein